MTSAINTHSTMAWSTHEPYGGLPGKMLRSGTMAKSIAPYHVVSGGRKDVLPSATGMATHNARTVGGVMVVEGAQVVVGDVSVDADVGYEVLCRRHHMRRMTRASAHAVSLSPDVLPLDLDMCPLPVREPRSPVADRPVPVDEGVSAAHERVPS